MKKLFAIITVLFLAAGITVAQDAGKKADQTTVSGQKQTTNCDMKNFCCMRAGRMTCIKDGQEVGMPADMNLKSGAMIKTNGTLTNAKGMVVSLKEGDAIDMDGNRCTMTAVSYPDPAAQPVQVK
jgi:hypothetical protein